MTLDRNETLFAVGTQPAYHLLNKNLQAKQLNEFILSKLKRTIIISALSATSLVNYYFYQARQELSTTIVNKKITIEPQHLESLLSSISQKCEIFRPNLNQKSDQA